MRDIEVDLDVVTRREAPDERGGSRGEAEL